MKKIRAIFVLIEFSLTVLCVIVLMYLFKSKIRAIRTKWANMQKFLIGYDVKIKGKLDLDADIYLMNHQSLLDIVAVESFHPSDLAWVAKKEIGELPLFGHILKAPNMIAIDRENKRSIIQLIKDVKDRLQKGRKIAMFPEGTRSNGDKILKFKSGAKMVIEKLDLKVQPIVIKNTNDILDSKKLEVQSGTVDISILPSFKPEKGSDWFERLRQDMTKEFES